MPLMFYHFVIQRNPVIYYPSGTQLYLFNVFFLPLSSSSVSTWSKMDQFSCYFFFQFSPQFSLLNPHIPPFRVTCHSDKSSQGGFRQSAVTHVPTGAESEHSRQRDASALEIYAGGFIVVYFIWGNAGPVLMSVLHLWTGTSCREAHGMTLLTVSAVINSTNKVKSEKEPSVLSHVSYVVISSLQNTISKTPLLHT